MLSFYLDAVIKQQLNSLVFVKNLCDTRIQRLKDGLDEMDSSLSGVGERVFSKICHKVALRTHTETAQNGVLLSFALHLSKDKYRN